MYGRRTSWLLVAAVLAAGSALAGCGGLGGPNVAPWAGLVVDDASPVARPYTGPLDAALAAGRAVDCEAELDADSEGPLNDGLLEGDETPERALAEFLTEPFRMPVPRTGYRVERATADRVLFTLPVAGRNRVAMVVVNDRDEDTYLEDWGVESYAYCNPAEFPASADADLVSQVWTDPTGARVHTGRIQSYPGHAHCSTTSITFVQLGGHQTPQYLRDPAGIYAQYTRVSYEPTADLPSDARDSGFRRDGAELGLTDDAGYLVTPDNVERLPKATMPLYCD